MKTPRLIIGLCLSIFLGLIPLNTKSQTGSLDVCVSCIGGGSIAGAIISVGNLYIDTTGTSGCVYFTDIPVGTWDVTCEIEGYSIPPTMVEIIEGMTTQSNFELYCSIFIVDPLNIEAWLEPNQQEIEIITLSNPGLESVDWSADLEIFPPAGTDDFLDVQFMYPLSGTTGEKGIECDSEYFYVTSINGEVYKYALDGTFLETFSIGFNFSDLAFNGTYFYGGTGSLTIYEMDFYTQTIVSTFTAPENVRAIAYNHDENIFYGYSWGGNIIAFDPSGAMLGSAPVGPSEAVYSGFAYDNVTEAGPYLWGYGLTGSELNVLVQLQLPSLQETGFTVNLDSLLGVPLNNVSGGLFTHPEILPDTWTLGGVVTDEWIWGLELAETFTWISIEPTSGTLGPGESEEMEVYLDATDYIPWTYQADIQFSTIPNVGSPVVDVTMVIPGPPMPPYDLEATINCVTVDLIWELSNLYYPPVTFNVYRNEEMIANVPDKFYSDSLVIPEVQYEYAVSAVYTIGETMPSFPINITVPLPDELEPLNLDFTYINGGIICFSWETNACLQPETYSLYRNSELIAILFEPEYCDTLTTPGLYEYYVTATYYFGDFGPSNTFYFIFTETSEIAQSDIKLFPNPTKDNLFIKSPKMIERIEIFNNTGRVITNKKVNSKSYQLDVLHFNPGIYFIKIETEYDMILRKIVIE